MPDITKLFDWQYIAVTPPVTMIYFWPVVVILAIFVLAGITLLVIRKYINREDHLTKRLLGLTANWLFYPSIIGLLLIFFRNQGINLLSWRLWLVLLILIWISGIIYIVFFLVFEFSRERRKINIQKIKSKYMPGPQGSGGKFGSKN